MPYILCPICGSLMHVVVAAREKWYEERYPGVALDSLVPAKCMCCWPEILPGDRVTIRASLDRDRAKHLGLSGTVLAAISRPEDGTIYSVALDGGATTHFTRAELRKASS